MKSIVKFIRKWRKPESKVLGRWAVEDCHKKINTKVDWSNEDHCGPCGTYLIQKPTLVAETKKGDNKNN